MKHVTKFYSKKFSGGSTKEAYLKACKWVATNILADDEISKDVTWSITKSKDLPTVELELFGMVNDTEHVNQFCKVCKEFHCSFYINQQQNCNNCNMMAYRSQAEEKGRLKKNYKRKLLSEKVLL